MSDSLHKNDQQNFQAKFAFESRPPFIEKVHLKREKSQKYNREYLIDQKTTYILKK